MKTIFEKTDQGDFVSTGSAEAITDGVFAVAMTILVLAIHIPSQDELVSMIQLNSYLQGFTIDIYLFILCFLILGSIWIEIRFLLHNLEKMDKIFMWLTLLILMFVVLVPVTYPLISDFGTQFFIFRYLFHINLLLIGLLMLFQYIYAEKKGFFSNIENYAYKKRTAFFFPLIAFIALILSFFISGSSVVYFLLFFDNFIVKIPDYITNKFKNS
ncbi:hypothetical protein SDC9_08394 [bioreactor metagenome]|uniref:Potassium channel n=1 Tax=bioreactor metagenome TaxID=1076179 RepID=A0A644T7I5_9ZZZZ|nr:TMEM175 family protein [Methanobrevibacter sp.]MEA4957301.1 TMEM175 family protein [Methanobrevibacter sp.]